MTPCSSLAQRRFLRRKPKEKSVAGHLPPNSLLVFDVEIVSATEASNEIAEEDLDAMEEDQIAESTGGTEEAAAS